ncbi:hypothetical protein JXA88_11430, partial [Candidatus Fermentibacteria bacterium]|nr:hypothetical protein [Candidatus Fermentibacteria bacterium]
MLPGLGATLIAAMTASAATVTFRVEPDSLPENAQVYVVGNLSSIGSWRPGATPLFIQADGAWERSFFFPVGTLLEYKITLGSWDHEALRGDGSVPDNSMHTVIGDTVLTTVVPAWKEERPLSGGITGTTHTHPAMRGKGLLPRDIHVWLPPGYDEETVGYPVIYMHDGQQVFDPTTSSFGADWRVDEVASELIGMGALPSIIVVAINNTGDRYAEYSDTDKGAAYRRFVISTLKPFIDRTYRTLPDREHTAVMGSSMGGLAAFLLVWHHADVFSRAACLSPAFFLDDLRKTSAGPAPALPVRLYLDNGGIGLEHWLQAGCDRMLEILQRKGMVVGENLIWFQDIEAEHNEEAWAERVWRPLSFMFGVGDQPWIAELPPIPAPLYAARDEEPLRMHDRPPLTVAGVEGECTIHECGERIKAVVEEGLGILERHITEPDAEYVAVLDGPGLRARFTMMIGVITADAPEGMDLSVRALPPARCRVIEHQGGLDTLAETLDY